MSAFSPVNYRVEVLSSASQKCNVNRIEFHIPVLWSHRRPDSTLLILLHSYAIT